MDRPESGFLGLPVEPDHARLDAEVVILGVPHGWPYPRVGTTAGCAQAPGAVRRRSGGLARFRDHWDFDLDAPMLPHDGPRLVDGGDVPGDPADGPGNSERTTAAVAGLLARGAIPICIGGDDSIPIPVLRAFADDGPLVVLQVDAHLDFRDEVDGVRDGYSSPMRRASEMPHVARIVQVGLRGVGSAREQDVRDAHAAGGLLVPAAELRDRGVPWLLEQLPADARIFVALDLDGLDPSVCPAVSAPAPGGLDFDQARSLVAGIGSRLAGAAVTEYVPELDPNDRTALVATRLIVLLAGGVGRHRVPTPDAAKRLT